MPQLRSMFIAQPRGDKDMPTLDAINKRYAKGKLPPNYPVPAIRLEVDICHTWDNEVHIWEGNAAVYSYVCLSKGY